MADRIKMTCSCGATMETESSLISTVSDRQKWFQNAHIPCLEAQQETPALADLSALIPGPVVKRYGSAIASLDTIRGQFHLTVETGDCSKSISFTWREWGAICQLFSTPQPTSESPTPSTVRQADGGRGVASPDPSPVSVAQGERVEWRWTDGRSHEFEGTGTICKRCGLGYLAPQHSSSPHLTNQEGES